MLRGWLYRPAMRADAASSARAFADKALRTRLMRLRTLYGMSRCLRRIALYIIHLYIIHHRPPRAYAFACGG